MNKHFSQLALLLTLALTATTASAHTGSHEISGFISGLSHPFLGLDHLLVMLSVGLWASRLNRVNASLTIAAFLTFMLIGAGFTLCGIAVQGLETGILASVLIVGLLLATTKQLPTVLTASLLASFALLHGYAHGLEMPLAANASHYALGFVLAIAILNSIGLGLGLILHKQHSLRIFGFITSVLGLWLFVNA